MRTSTQPRQALVIMSISIRSNVTSCQKGRSYRLYWRDCDSFAKILAKECQNKSNHLISSNFLMLLHSHRCVSQGCRCTSSLTGIGMIDPQKAFTVLCFMMLYGYLWLYLVHARRGSFTVSQSTMKTYKQYSAFRFYSLCM